MTPADVLDTLRRKGLRATAEPGGLRVRPTSALTDELIALAREHKPAILTLLADAESLLEHLRGLGYTVTLERDDGAAVILVRAPAHGSIDPDLLRLADPLRPALFHLVTESTPAEPDNGADYEEGSESLGRWVRRHQCPGCGQWATVLVTADLDSRCAACSSSNGGMR